LSLCGEWYTTEECTATIRHSIITQHHDRERSRKMGWEFRRAHGSMRWAVGMHQTVAPADDVKIGESEIRPRVSR
jgi:hypothetical protein